LLDHRRQQHIQDLDGVNQADNANGRHGKRFGGVKAGFSHGASLITGFLVGILPEKLAAGKYSLPPDDR
jgi:hypothetical protein